MKNKNYRKISRKFILFAADEVRDFYEFIDSILSFHVGGKEIVLLSASEV